MSKAIDIDTWLSKTKIVEWNASKTVAKLSLFEVPFSLVFDQELLLSTTERKENDLINSTINDSTSSLDYINRGITCNSCGLSFDSYQEQRQHFKTDIHIINLKRHLNNLPPLKESDFTSSTELTEAAALSLQSSSIYNDVDSIDKTDEDDDGEDEQDSESLGDTTESTNINTKKTIKSSTTYGNCIKTYSNKVGHQLILQKRDEIKWDIIMTTSSLYTLGHQLNERTESDSSILSILQGMASICNEPQHIWAVFILRSGKFAGTVFNKRESLIHKVFKRYTVRAKAGGSQSSHDNEAGKAKSMGAQLRRHGKMHLINMSMSCTYHCIHPNTYTSMHICL